MNILAIRPFRCPAVRRHVDLPLTIASILKCVAKQVLEYLNQRQLFCEYDWKWITRYLGLAFLNRRFEIQEHLL